MIVHSKTAPQLSSWSWQQIHQTYRQYGLQLAELARLKKTFRFGLKQRGVNYMFDFVSDSFQRNVDEIDGMLILLDAEIARRDTLIGVMG